jgi:hypothetical protein
MLNLTQVPAPRVPLIDSSTGLVSMEWFRFFNGLYAVVGANQNVIQPANGGTGLSTLPANGQLLIGNDLGYTLNTLTPGAGISITNGAGSITLANAGVSSWSGGTTGLTPATPATGAVTLSGLLNVFSGGTGQSTYVDGQLLIGNTTGNTLGKATLTAGAGIVITNGPSAITIAQTSATIKNYGAFHDTSTQTAAAATPTAITLNSTDLSVGVARGTPTSRIVITNAGIYNLQFSLQLSNTSAQIDDVTIWLRQNGVDVPNSAGLDGVSNKHGAINGHIIIGWNYLLTAAAGDYFELYWTTDSGASSINTYPASAVAPVHPASPAVILTVQQV